jgi:probable HAF family extracellular repeat protein
MSVRLTERLARAAIIIVSTSGIALSAFAAPPKYRLTRIPLPGIQGLSDSLGLEFNDAGDVLIRFYNGQRPATQTTFLYKDGTLIDMAPNARQVLGFGMNGRGDVVGQFVDEDANIFAFVFINGEFIKLPASVQLPAGNFVLHEGSAVNDAGLVLGQGTFQSDGSNGSFLWNNGTISLLPPGPFSSVDGWDVNNAGEVTGGGRTPAGESHVFLRSDGETTDLGTIPGYSSITGVKIRKTGIIAGFGFITGNTMRVFRYFNGALVDLGSLGGESVDVYDMNNAGHIVGISEDPNGDFRAFLDNGQAMIDLGTFGGNTSSGASDITENGQICGAATRADGSSRAFIRLAGANAIVDLNALIADSDPLKPFVTLHDAVGVNEFGQILAQGTRQGFDNIRTYIASPIDSTMPVIKSKLTGDSGTNGWFTSNVALTWTVTDAQAPIARKSGCGAKNVTTDTAGVEFTCQAESIGGTATKTETIKRDTVAPTAAIARPANGAVYARNQTVLAKYSCADSLSGIWSCSGPVANGAAIDTSAPVSNRKFMVKATDRAGLIKTVTRTYSVQ